MGTTAAATRRGRWRGGDAVGTGSRGRRAPRPVAGRRRGSRGSRARAKPATATQPRAKSPMTVATSPPARIAIQAAANFATPALASTSARRTKRSRPGAPPGRRRRPRWGSWRPRRRPRGAGAGAAGDPGRVRAGDDDRSGEPEQTAARRTSRLIDRAAASASAGSRWWSRSSASMDEARATRRAATSWSPTAGTPASTDRLTSEPTAPRSSPPRVRLSTAKNAYDSRFEVRVPTSSTAPDRAPGVPRGWTTGASDVDATRPAFASSRCAIVPCMMPARRPAALATVAGTCVTVVLSAVLVWPALDTASPPFTATSSPSRTRR